MISINNLTPNIVTLTQQKKDSYTIDYGSITKKSPREVVLEVKSDKNFKHFSVSAGCGGCTRAKYIKLEEGYYKAIIEFFKDHSTIDKRAYISYRLEDENRIRKITINIKGNVTND